MSEREDHATRPLGYSDVLRMALLSFIHSLTHSMAGHVVRRDIGTYLVMICGFIIAHGFMQKTSVSARTTAGEPFGSGQVPSMPHWLLLRQPHSHWPAGWSSMQSVQGTHMQVSPPPSAGPTTTPGKVRSTRSARRIHRPPRVNLQLLIDVYQCDRPLLNRFGSSGAVLGSAPQKWPRLLDYYTPTRPPLAYPPPSPLKDSPATRPPI